MATVCSAHAAPRNNSSIARKKINARVYMDATANLFFSSVA
jgi:hypothetical protein